MLEDPFISPEREYDIEGQSMTGPSGLWAAEAYTPEADFWAGPMRVHVHSNIEVGITLAGEIDIFYRDQTLRCKPGDVWLCATWEPHGWRHASDDQRVIDLQFRPEFIGEELLGAVPWLTLFAASPSERPRANTLELRRRVLGVAETMREEIRARLPAWESIIRFEVLRLLTELARAWEQPAWLKDTESPQTSDIAGVMPALNLVHTMPWGRVSNVEAARACGMGIPAFLRVFRRVFQMSFQDFGMRARLSFAARQLLNTNQTVAAISAESGFVDASHLRRCFRQQYHCTPLQYRRRKGLSVATTPTR